MSVSPLSSSLSSPVVAAAPLPSLRELAEAGSLTPSFAAVASPNAAMCEPADDESDSEVTFATDLPRSLDLASVDAADKIEGLSLQEKLAEARMEGEKMMSSKVNELEGVVAKQSASLATLTSEKSVLESRVVQLLTQLQSQSLGLTSLAEVEEALSCAQARAGQYVSEIKDLRQKLSELTDPNSSFHMERENGAMEVHALREQLKAAEAARDQLIEEAQISAEAEKEAEAQISQWTGQDSDGGQCILSTSNSPSRFLCFVTSLLLLSGTRRSGSRSREQILSARCRFGRSPESHG
jgi:hypothetical protein